MYDLVVNGGGKVTVLYAKDGPAWSSKTDTTEPPPPAPEAEAPEVAPAAAEEAVHSARNLCQSAQSADVKFIFYEK